MNANINAGVGGLIIFNADGSATYFAKRDGNDVAKLRGHVDAAGGSFANGSDTLVLKAVANNPKLKARGTLVLNGEPHEVVAFVNSDGSVGIKPNAPLPARASCPW
jgi:hypothetical protein